MYKAKQKTVSLIVACLTFFVTMVMAFACLFNAPTINVASAAGESYSYTFTAKQFTANGTKNLNSVNWTLAGGGGYWGYDSTKGQQLGSGSNPYKSLTLTSAEFTNVSEIKINTSGASSIKATFTVSVGDTQIGNSTSLTTTATEYTFETDTPLTGAVKFSYTQTSSKAIYIKSITITYGATPACEHADTTISTTNATCTTAGSETVKCNACGETISTTVIPALGHDVESKPVSNNDKTHTYSGECNTCGETVSGEVENCTFERVQDEPKYTCTECGYFYTVNEYTVSFNVPNDVPAVDSVKVEEGKSTALPSAENYDKYTFVGWTTEEYEKTTEKPEILKGEYAPEGDVTLYALYSYSEGGTGKWEKVTDASDLAVGKEIIIVNADGDYALSTNQKDSNRGATGFGADDVQIITLEEGTVAGTFAFNVGNGYLYAASSGSNHLKTQTSNNANGSWLITIDSNGVATILAQGNYTRNLLRFNPNNSGLPLFSCYVTNSTTGSLPSIYMIAGETYYTTGEAVQPEPTPETKITAASLTLGTTLTMNYYVTLLDEHVGATMSITMTGEETKAVQGVFQEDGDYKGQYVFSFEIPPQYMATTINAQLVFEGETIAELNDYSIKKYAQNQLNKLNDNPNDELKQLLTDLLYYGDAAYNFVNKTTGETPVTSGVENIGTASLATSQTTFELVDNAEINEYPAYFVSAGVWFDNVNQLYVKLNTTENVTLKINGTAVAVTGKTVYTDGIFATDFDKEFTFELYHGETLMQTLKYSVNAYAKAMENDALALALYRYGASAEAYAN